MKYDVPSQLCPIHGPAVEASDLGLRAGAGWPQILVFPSGLEMSYQRQTRDAEGELISVTYSGGGRTLEVFND